MITALPVFLPYKCILLNVADNGVNVLERADDVNPKSWTKTFGVHYLCQNTHLRRNLK
jgi:hypothetical protein